MSTKTRTEDVIQELREQVLNGRYAPSARLQEESLAEAFNVSRTPIRDALRVLARDGLLIYSPNRGYMVRPFSLKDILDAYDVRATLEGMACAIMAEKGLGAERAAQITEILACSQNILQHKSWHERHRSDWNKLNFEFHLTIVKGTENRHLIETATHMRQLPRVYDSRLEPQASFFQQIHTRERRARSHIEHCEVFDAITKRQSGRAESLMREHVHRNRNALEDRFKAFAETNSKAV